MQFCHKSCIFCVIQYYGGPEGSNTNKKETANKKKKTQIQKMKNANKSHFLFDDQYYDQIDGVAMGSPLGPVLANICMCHFEERWVKKGQIRPSLWYRYVDDTFTMFESKDTANEFLRYLNSRHESVKFTIDFEQDNEVPFLDILIKRCPNNTFATSIY